MSGIIEVASAIMFASAPICTFLLSPSIPSCRFASNPISVRRHKSARTTAANRNINPSGIANDLTRRTTSRKEMFASTALVHTTSSISILDENIDFDDSITQGTQATPMLSSFYREKRDESSQKCMHCRDDKEVRDHNTIQDSFNFENGQYDSKNTKEFLNVSPPQGMEQSERISSTRTDEDEVSIKICSLP